MKFDTETWRPDSAEVTFPSDRIDIWRVYIDDALLSDSFEMLSPDELARAARFHCDRDRRRFAGCRSVLRTLLGRYLTTSPSRVRFRYEKNGKPELADLPNSAPLHFNVAHSEGLALIAITSGRAVGVDVERIRELEVLEVAKHFFSEREVKALLSLPENLRQPAFFACWTRKEALIKAMSEGFSRPLPEVGLFEPADCLASLSDVKGEPAAVSGWSMVDMRPAEGFRGALAFEGSPCRMECRCWERRSGSLVA